MQGQTGQLRTLALLLAALSNFEKFTSTLPHSLPVTGTKGLPFPAWSGDQGFGTGVLQSLNITHF